MTVQTRNTSKTKTQATANPFKEAFIAERKKLIEDAKVLRADREKLRGVSGTQQAWRDLTSQIAALQTRINSLNDSLGIKNKTFPPLAKPGAAPATAHDPKQRNNKNSEWKGRNAKYKTPGDVGVKATA